MAKSKGGQKRRFTRHQDFETQVNTYVEMVDGQPAQLLTEDEFQAITEPKKYFVSGEPVPKLDKGAKKRLKARQKAQTAITQKPAAPSEARLKRGGLSKADIKSGLAEQYGTPAEGYWDGMTEKEWYRKSQDAHEQIAQRGQRGRNGYNAAIIRDGSRFPDFPDNEVGAFAGDALKGQRVSRHIRYGVPHAAASESMQDSYLAYSGDLVSKGNSGSTFDTDLHTQRLNGVDVQDVMAGGRNNAQMSFGVWNNLDGNSGWQAFEDAADEDLMDDIIQRANRSGRGKPDKLLDDGKEWLMGHVRDRNETPNVMGNPSRGTYNQTPGYSEYAIDMRDARPKIKGMTKGQWKALGGSVRDTPGQMRLEVPLKGIQEELGQVGKIKQIIDTDVLESIDELGRSNGIRRAGDVSYHSVIPGVDPADVGRGLKRGWRGGLGLTALDGTSREVGVKVGQGDYKGAAVEYGKTYAMGAAFEKGIRTAGSVLAKKLPGIGARFTAGSAGSGGLLAPVMATIGAVEVADGLVEGVTGKDTISHVNDGMVRPYYQRTTGDNRTEEEIQSNLTGPKTVYKAPEPKGPSLTREAIDRASQHLSKAAPQVKVDAPKPQVVKEVTPTITPTSKPGWQKALDRAGGWVKGAFGL